MTASHARRWLAGSRLRPLRRRSRAANRRQQPQARRLTLESLEARRLLAIFWAVDQDGFWDVPTNWRDDAGVNRLPTAEDEVFLDRPSGAFVVTHRQGEDQVYSIRSSRSTFALTGGELYIFPYRGDVVPELGGDFNFSGGILEGPLTVSATTNWSGGAMRKSPGGHGGASLKNLGTMQLTAAAGVGGFINNYGTINDDAGFMPLLSTLENQSGGVYNVLRDVNPPSVFTNRGTLRKSGGTGVTAIPYFTNLGGTIEVLAGTLSVDGRQYSDVAPVQGRAWTGGAFQVSQGAFLDLVGANSTAGYDLLGNYTGAGEGKVRYRGDALKIAAADVTFHFSQGPFEIQSAFIDAGAFGLKNLGSMAIAGATPKFLSGALMNSGVFAHAASGGLSGGTINNLAGGLFDLQGDFSLTSPVINAGTFRKSAGAGTIALRPFRNNGGAVEVRSGILSIDGTNGDGIAPAWTGGRFDVSAGAVLNWVGANAFQRYDIVGAFSGSGAGRIHYTPAIQTVGAAGASFAFAPGLFYWTSEQNSRFDGGALTNVGEIALDGAGAKFVTGTFTNAGKIIHQGAAELEVVFGVTFTNLPGAVYEFRGDRSILGTGTFFNRGTVRKTTGSGISVLGRSFANEAGAIDVQTGTVFIGHSFSGGNTTVNRGGDFQVAANAVLELSAGGITTNYEGSFNGSGGGTIRLSDGRILAGATGATFNFPGTMFEWTGGILDGGVAGINNTGNMALAGANPKTLQGLVNNVGAIHHGGTANLAFVFGQLVNLAGALYDFQSDVSFVRNFSDNTLVRNSGTIRKSSGAGLATTFVPFHNLGGTIDVRSGTFVMNAAGETIVHDGGTFLVAANARLDLTGGDRGSTARIKGVFRGEGAGNVLFSGGSLVVDAAGAAFDFQPGVLQWIGGTIDARLAAFTNRGFMTLPEFGLQPVVAGSFLNAGTVTSIDDANLLIRGEAGTGVFTNLPGGLFEFQGAGGLVRPLDGVATFANQGALRRTGAAGTATIAVQVFENNGTLLADGGILRIESTTLPQVSGSALTAGTWMAAAGGGIDLVSAPALATNAANVTLDGAGSSFAKLDSIASNLGSWSLLGGRDFATAGALTNAGRITLGAGSTLLVNGNAAQAAQGTLAVQLGGAPESGLFGQLTSAAPAVLDGVFEVSLSGGFGPAAGQNFQVMSFPSYSGAFSAYAGLTSGRFPLFDAQLSAAELRLIALTNTADLAFDSFVAATFPGSAAVGQNVTLAYSARNLSELPVTGDWIDSVYLSRDGVLDPADTLLARVDHAGGVAGLGNYSKSVTAALPATAEGAYRVIVLTDSRGLASDADRDNNLGVSTQAIQISVPALTVGVPVNGSIEPGQDVYYRVLAPPGSDLTVAVDFAAAPGAEVSLRYGALPDDTAFDDLVPAGNLRPRLLLANAQGGVYYLKLRGREDASGPIAYTIEAETSGFEITRVSPRRGSNLAAAAIVEMRGSQFTPQTQLRLSLPGGASRLATSMKFVNANRTVATIDLTGLAAGNYQIIAEDSGRSTLFIEPFEVTENPPGKAGAYIWLKTIAVVEFRGTISRSWRNQRIAFGEYNSSDSPLPAPLYLLRATNVQPGQEVQGSLGSNTVPPRMLPANYRDDDVNIYTYKPLVSGNHVKSTYDLYLLEPNETSMEWDSRKDSLRPPTIEPDAWDAIWENLRPRLGETLADFWLLLTEDSERLAAVGETVQAVDRLFSFELQKANNMPAAPVPAAAVDAAFPAPGLPLIFGRSFGDSITSRYRQGRLGRGWVDSFEISIDEDVTTGMVNVFQGGQSRFFVRQEDGSYAGFPGDSATLTKVGGGFRLREKSGEATAFLADGQWDYLEDANGNRITAGYSGGALTTLTHSSGAVMTLSYTAGRLSQVVDPAGGVATYEYDPTGQHLTRVTTIAGVTEYAYTPDIDGPSAHALSSITFVDGAHLFFEYDGNGRLARQQGDGGAEAVRYSYDLTSFSLIDAQNQTTTYIHDDSFSVRKVVDPLGRVQSVTYDEANRPILADAEGGGASSYGYDALGNPNLVRNPLGESQGFSYESAHSGMIQWRDSLGRETRFERDVRGNLLSSTHVDGSNSQFEYNAQGNVVRSVNRLGQAIQFTYNGNGQVTQKDLPDGSQVKYTYNARGNLETLVNAAGTTRLEYLDAQNPNLATKVTYPNGRFLAYAFENGRRVRMVDQTGFETRYAYDALGRLDVLRDGAAQLITDYDYDAVGRLSRETRGNGTVTEYVYYDDGQVREITHRAPDGTIQSKLVYEYDQLGRRSSTTTSEGVTTYEYDGAGRLTSVTLPNLRIISYEYDAAGNRLVSRNNFATTNYAVNDLNQYVAFGSTGQQFDAGGNLVASAGANGSASYRYDFEGRLVSQITPAGTWTYEYDAFGSRIASTYNGVRTEYLVDPAGLGNVVAEFDGSGSAQAHYVHGNGLASRVDTAGAAAFYQFDAIGNTTQLTGAGGAVLNSYSYLPFGEALATSEAIANPFEYVGQFGVQRDGSGLDYMRNRWYAPAQGRFTQSDPIGLAGGTNFYAYVGNNPLSFADPSGLEALTLTGAAAAAWVYGNAATAIISPTVMPGVSLGGEPVTRLVLQWFGSSSPFTAASGLSSPYVTQSANPLYHRVGQPGGNTFAQVEAAVARAQMLLRLRAIGAAALRGGAYVAIAAGIASIAHSIWALETFVTTGNDVGCVPGIPAEIQVCNPRVDFLTGKHIQSLEVTQENPAEDPNDIIGPAGYGPDGYIRPEAPLAYTINFENKSEAVGPAAEVFVTLQLDADLDLDSFQLDMFGFGELVIAVPAGRQSYSTRLDLTATRGVFVDISFQLDRATRTVTWTLQSIEPETLDLPGDPSVGFLPPNRTSPEGQGFVSYSVRAKAGLPSGARIEAQASIVFDTNPAILTNVAVNTLDIGEPTSRVSPLPAQSPLRDFPLRWEQSDDAGGSGVASVDIFVSIDGAPPVLLLDDQVGTTATVQLAPQHDYAFFSVATDNVGHEEVMSAVPDAVVRIVPGDVNLDGVIDLNDLNGVRNNFGRTGENLLGDTDFDGDVDLDDLNNLRNYFGLGTSPAAAPGLRTDGLAVAHSKSARSAMPEDLLERWPQSAHSAALNALLTLDAYEPAIGSRVGQLERRKPARYVIDSGSKAIRPEKLVPDLVTRPIPIAASLRQRIHAIAQARLAGQRVRAMNDALDVHSWPRAVDDYFSTD